MPLVRVLGRPFGVPVGDPPWAVQTVALVLLVILVVLPPLAHVSPPDSLWIIGVYDDVDFDEVLVAVGSAIGHVEDSRLPVGKPTIFLVATLPLDAAIAPAVFRSTCSVRAPPT